MDGSNYSADRVATVVTSFLALLLRRDTKLPEKKSLTGYCGRHDR